MRRCRRLLPTGNPAQPFAAIPRQGNFVPLVGGARDQGTFNGARVTFGQWFDPAGELGAEVSAFLLERRGTVDVFNGSPTLPVVSVPVIGTNGVAAVYDFAFPGRFAGGLTLRTATQFGGAEGNLLHRWYGNGCLSVDGLLGYRYLQLNERLDLFGRSQSAGAIGTFAGAVLPPGVAVFTRDSFRANTQFHGAQVGARMEWRRDMFTITAFGKGGAGINLQTLRVDGSTTATGLGVTRTVFGGVRALPGNFGRDTNTRLLADRRDRYRTRHAGDEAPVLAGRLQPPVLVGRSAGRRMQLARW